MAVLLNIPLHTQHTTMHNVLYIHVDVLLLVCVARLFSYVILVSSIEPACLCPCRIALLSCCTATHA